MKINGVVKTALSLATVLSTGIAIAEESNPAAITCTVSSGHHVYVEQKTCPIGGERYSAFVLGTHSTFGAYLDLTKVSYLTFPIAVPVCPSNGFVHYKNEYSEVELEQLTAAIETPEYKEQLGKHTSWYLFADLMVRADLAQDDAIELWWIRSRAAAEAEACETEQFGDYAQLALTQIDIELGDQTTADESFWPMQLMAANYERRLGDKEKAIQRLALLPEIPQQWTIAFETLAKAIEFDRIDRVRIGEFEDENAAD